ncbi:MAG: hypothetical protein DSY33_01065 [Archaeoglobus sp.]|nr:MAG: hypothetical protein DSY33_01065 [Archaeoglobus sp.]
MKIIAFVGLPLSGKSTASSVAREMGIPVVVMGDVVREEVEKRGLPLTDENAGKVANELRKMEGMDAIAKRCIKRIREKNADVIVVDGIRGLAEVDRFKKTFGDDFVLVAIECPLELRFERLKNRQRDDDLSIRTVEDLKRRDEREIAWGMLDAMNKANLTVENTSDLDDFKEKIREILRAFTKGVEAEVEVKVNPTEDIEKVKKAVENLFPGIELKYSKERSTLRGKTDNLEKFRELLRMQRILDTARTELRKGWKGNESTVFINKQAATVSRINFAEENTVLSPIVVTFRAYGVSFEKFIDWLTPETRNGKPIKEVNLWEE